MDILSLLCSLRRLSTYIWNKNTRYGEDVKMSIDTALGCK